MTSTRFAVVITLALAGCSSGGGPEGRVDGETCSNDGDCRSGHCGNGFCCGAGDCCAQAADCPGTYARPATCDDPTGCQGTRIEATCLDHRCGLSAPVADDTACAAGTQALDCTPYPPVFCTGGEVQAAPQCAEACLDDTGCVEGFHCAGTCQADLQDGFSCQRDGECTSGHCQNGFCCAQGDCCAEAADCPDGYASPPSCVAQTSCQGERTDVACVESVCQGQTLPDDSGCFGLVANDCGPFPSAICTSASDQSPPSCATFCAGHADCDPAAHCSGGLCVPDQPAGGQCAGPEECQDSLVCVDGVCCTSACTGTCRACDLPGSEGTCTLVPAGWDPDEECGAVSCTGYYAGWLGDSCRARASISAAGAYCDGGGACQGPAALCPAAPAGATVLTCNATCQDPAAGTCQGMTAGICTNVNPGNITCGVGACERTVAACVNGSPSACVPGPAVAETCNNLDDDCDGTVDDVASAADSYEPNQACSSSRTLPVVAETNAEVSFTATIYPAGDQDYYRVLAEEGTSLCFPGTSQSFSFRVRLVPPTGDDCVDYDLELLLDNCLHQATSQAGGCATETLEFNWSGTCGLDDSRYFRVRVYPYGSAWECVPYTLALDMLQN